MTDADSSLLAELLDQEQRLVFDRFDNDTAIALGQRLVERARAENLAVVVDIARGEQRLFYCALAGTSADNEFWVERKKRAVRRFGHSSFYLGRKAKADGVDFAEKALVDPADFGAHGGCFPVLVRDVGMVGTITVSGLPQAEDHRLVVETLADFLAEGAAGGPRTDVWTA